MAGVGTGGRMVELGKERELAGRKNNGSDVPGPSSNRGPAERDQALRLDDSGPVARVGIRRLTMSQDR